MTIYLYDAVHDTLWEGGVGGLRCRLLTRLAISGEPFVEWDGEGEEFVFVVQGVDHLDVELGVFEGWVVEFFDVVEEVAGEGAVGVDDGAVEAEVGVVLGDLLVDGGVVDGDRDDGDPGSLCALSGEEAAIDVFEESCGELVVVGGDELDAYVFEGECGVSVVGDDDEDGEETVLDVGKAEEGAVFGVVAGFGGDGDVLVGVGVEGGVLVGRLGWRGLFVGGEGAGCEEAGGEDDARGEGLIGLHGQVDYDLRW